MNNSEFYPQWTCGLKLMEEIDILRDIKRIVDQDLVMDLKQGNFLIQFVFYKDYTCCNKEIFSLLLFSIQNISVFFFFLWEVFPGTSVYIICCYCMMSFLCTLPNILLWKKTLDFPSVNSHIFLFLTSSSQLMVPPYTQVSHVNCWQINLNSSFSSHIQSIIKSHWLYL